MHLCILAGQLVYLWLCLRGQHMEFSEAPCLNPTQFTYCICCKFLTILEAGEVSVLGDFFLLGGDSLRAGRCIAALRKEFGVELKVVPMPD